MQLRNIVDGLWRRADAFAHPMERRQATSGKVLTIVQVITSVQPQTFSGSAVMVTSTVGKTGASAIAGGALLQSRTSSADSAASTDSSGDSASSDSQSAAATSGAAQSSKPSSAAASSQVSQITSAPIVNASPSNVQGSAASQSASASPAAASGGMSGGAKAGLAFGILFLIGALLAGVLMVYRRQKQKKEAHERLDDEKAAMSQPRNPDTLPRNPEPAFPLTQATAPAARSQETLNAPRLELRPVTQFDPRMSTMNNGAPGAGAALGAAAAAGAIGGAATMAANNTASSPSPSSWEKRGAQQHANDPTNPFGNHAETLNNSPPQTAQGASAPRVPSLGHIDAADFPLPLSGQVSPKPVSLQFDGSTDSLPNPVIPYAPATVSNVSLPVSEIAAAGVAGIVVAGAGAAVVAGRGGNSPPLDNVHRVQLDFKPSMEDELEIRAGQLVRLLHEYDDGWALCSRMDRSQQGVVPRTCLSKHLVKPRPNPNGSPSGAPPSGPPQARPSQNPRGPGPNGSPQMRGPPMPGSGRNSPAPFAQVPRPLTPTGRNSPAPYPGGRASPAPFAQAPHPQSPAGGPQQRSRAQSNAAQYRAYQPGPGHQGQQQRSQSPGPYGPPGMMRPPPIKDSNRRRSNSMSNLVPGSAPIVAGNAPTMTKAPSLARKPVPGQAV